MTDHRVWHASRDAYHCAFRMVRLLIANGASIEIERMRVLDMFLLYPPLLHRSSMLNDIRKAFRRLDVPKPDQVFLRLPSAAAVFQDLRLYQNSAVAQLGARGLISAEDLRDGLLTVMASELPDDLVRRAVERNAAGSDIAQFLVREYSKLPLRGSGGMYRKAGLPARGLVR